MQHTNVIMKQHCWDKLQRWVGKVGSTEASGMGRVVFEDESIVVTHVYLLKAENQSYETEFSAEEMGKKFFETKEDGGLFNFWWHFHPQSMDVGPSAQDDVTIEKLGGKGWMLGGIFNGKGEANFRIFQGGDGFFPPMLVDNLPWELDLEYSADTISEWDKEFDENFQEAQSLYPSQGWADVWDDGERYYTTLTPPKQHPSWFKKGRGNPKKGKKDKKKKDKSFYDSPHMDLILHESEISTSSNECRIWYYKFVNAKKKIPSSAYELDAFFLHSSQTGGIQ